MDILFGKAGTAPFPAQYLITQKEVWKKHFDMQLSVKCADNWMQQLMLKVTEIFG